MEKLKNNFMYTSIKFNQRKCIFYLFHILANLISNLFFFIFNFWGVAACGLKNMWMTFILFCWLNVIIVIWLFIEFFFN